MEHHQREKCETERGAGGGVLGRGGGGYHVKYVINHVAPKTKLGAAGLGRKMTVQLCCGLVFDVPVLDKWRKYCPQIGTQLLPAITENQ